MLAHPVYFSINRRAIARGVALGLFIAFMPLLGHIPLVLVLGLLFRVNLPVAGVVIWVANPLTYGIIFYFEYRLGLLLMNRPPGELPADWAALLESLSMAWQPLLIGALVVGFASAAIGYLLADFAWRAATRWRYHRRLQRRSLAAAAKGD